MFTYYIQCISKPQKSIYYIGSEKRHVQKEYMRAKFYKVIPHSKNRACNYIFLDFVRLTFVKQSPLVLDGEQQLQKRKIEKVYNSQALEEVHMPGGATREGQRGSRQNGRTQGTCHYYGPYMECFGALTLDPGSIQIKMSKV